MKALSPHSARRATPRPFTQHVLELASGWMIQTRLERMAALEPLADRLWRTMLTRAQARACLLSSALSESHGGMWPLSVRHALRLGWIPRAFAFALFQLELSRGRAGLLLVAQPLQLSRTCCLLALELGPETLRLSWAVLGGSSPELVKADADRLLLLQAHKREALGGSCPLPTSWQENGAGFALKRPLAFVEECLELGLGPADRWMRLQEEALVSVQAQSLAAQTGLAEVSRQELMRSQKHEEHGFKYSTFHENFVEASPIPQAWILDGLPHREVLERRFHDLSGLPWLQVLSDPAAQVRAPS